MMFQVVSSLLLLSLFSVGQGNSKNVISVSNGGKLGDWGPVEMCPVGSRARGFSVKVEEFQWFGDDTSLNGIRLLCVSSNSNEEYYIQSTEGAWGSWTSPVRCRNGNLIAFNLRVSPPQGDGDDTAANNIVFMCSDKTILMKPGLLWGSFGRSSQICKIGICGISTRVEEYQGKGDDTALNDVKFTCCENCSCEYDVSFKRPQALDYFWTKYESLKNSELWKSFAAIPVSKPDTKEAWHNISKVWEQEVDFEDNEALYDRALKVADRICLDPPADGVGLVQPRDGACLDPPGDGACPGSPVEAVYPDTLTGKTIIESVNKAQEMSEDPLEGTSSNLLPAGEQSGESDDPTMMETQTFTIECRPFMGKLRRKKTQFLQQVNLTSLRAVSSPSPWFDSTLVLMPQIPISQKGLQVPQEPTMMFQAVSSLLLLSLFSVGYGQDPRFITASNGDPWGDWGDLQTCPDGYYARAFSLKVEGNQGSGDDTALNAIRLLCVSSNNEEYSIQSTEGPWGSWTSPVWCPNGNLIAFSLRVETPLWFGDDTAANNIMFKCSDNSILEGSGQSWGTYEGWSESCQIGICGIQTKVEPTQGDGDDTALNDVKFTCCVEDYYLVGLH
ncbi:uncharacterized protein LOC142471433 [Ascaphus truei]|uniref:uncharacterized protein LOC142471433 n=1 Tax=Ascaphus truei TaxID=8439 RepID=UPI003F5917B8